MSELDPTVAGQEAGRLHAPQAQHLAPPRNEEDSPQSVGRAERLEENRAPETVNDQRALEGNASADRLDLTAADPAGATGRTPENSAEARELAQETRERILDQPERAAEAVRDTAHEPASSRMSRAIEALS